MEKILVIGSGFLGSAILDASRKRGLGAAMASRSSVSSLDVRKIDTIERAVVKENPDVIINCAAATLIDEIERDPRDAYAVNGDGAGNIARIAAKHSKRLIHVSTDSVFDGKRGNYSEKDSPSPINEYARSKRNGEDLVMENASDYAVVRTNFYGDNSEGKFLFNWVLVNLRQGKKFGGFTDVIFNPLEIGNLSKMLLELAESNHVGMLHLGSDRPRSKYEFARTVAEKLGYDTGLVTERILSDGLPAARPRNTTLDNTLAKKILKTGLLTLESWLEGIYPSAGRRPDGHIPG